MGFLLWKLNEVNCVHVYMAPSFQQTLGDQGNGAERGNKLQKKLKNHSKEFAIAIEMENRLNQ